MTSGNDESPTSAATAETPEEPIVLVEAGIQQSENEETKEGERQGNNHDGDGNHDDERDAHFDFVNEGFKRWEESRASWLGKSDSSNSTARAAVPVDVDEIIDLIFSQRWRNPDENKNHFPQPVPLPQMVDILVDLWEAEGLDI